MHTGSTVAGSSFLSHAVASIAAVIKGRNLKNCFFIVESSFLPVLRLSIAVAFSVSANAAARQERWLMG